MNSKQNGDIGEKEVIDLVKCPHCGKKLMLLPPSYPLCDVQCTACHFRAQIKSANSKRKATIFGSGWDIMEKTFKAGFPIPPLILNFKWEEKGKAYQEILFYPFIPIKNLKKRVLSAEAKRANYKMFNYVNMDQLPFIVLYTNKDD